MAITVRHSYSVNEHHDIASVVTDSGTGRVLLYVASRTVAGSLPASVSYNGSALSSFTLYNWYAGSATWEFQVWYLLEPSVGTYTVESSNADSGYYMAACSTIDGVDTASFAAAFGTPASARGDSTAPTVDVAGGADKLIWGLIISNLSSPSITSPSTSLASCNDASNPSYIRTLSNSTGGNPQTIAGTSADTLWGIWGVAMNPAGDAPTNTADFCQFF